MIASFLGINGKPEPDKKDTGKSKQGIVQGVLLYWFPKKLLMYEVFRSYLDSKISLRRISMSDLLQGCDK